MKLKNEFIINDIAGNKIAVSVGCDDPKFKGYIKLDDNTAFVMEMLKNEDTEEDIVSGLVKKFGVTDNDELRANLRDLLEDFKKREII